MKKLITGIAVSAALMLALTACSSSGTNGQNDGVDSAVAAQVDAALAALDGQVLSLGPNGETPSSFDTTELTDDEVNKIKAGKYTAAIVMHYSGNDWSTAQIAGLNAEFARLGVKVVATTDAEFKPEKQVSDIETVMALKPDIIISIPTDPVATKAAFKKAAAAGIKLVFMDNVPAGMVGGKDYVSVVSADNKGNGAVSAHLFARALNGKGKVGKHLILSGLLRFRNSP
jgi:ribose transport system substrate-binding protein